MMVKDRRTKILLSLLLLSKDLSYVDFDSKLQKIFDLSLNQKTRGTLSGMIKEGLVEKFQTPEVKVQGGANKEEVSQYKLTEKGLNSLNLTFPYFRFLNDKWDGKWRIISYEIPESKRDLRDRLRREMQGWGLGPWHRSFWLTPHPILNNLRDLVFGREEEKYIQSFESSHVFGDRNVLIEKVWGKSDLDKRYRETFKKWHDILSKEGDKIAKFCQIVESYIEILRQDPGLPRELTGDKWIGFEAFDIFKEIRSILLS